MILVDTELNYCNEAIMNQHPSHSQTPEFDVNKSATSARLFQHPTPEEQRPTRWKNIFSNFCASMVVAICALAMTVLILKGCADEQERHQAVIEAQFIKGGK